MNGKWVVEVKGKRESGRFEISIVRKDNQHGKASWGWFDGNKLLVTHSGAGSVPMTKQIWDWQVAIANEVAEKLNGVEEQFNAGEPTQEELNRSPYYRAGGGPLLTQAEADALDKE